MRVCHSRPLGSFDVAQSYLGLVVQLSNGMKRHLAGK